MADVLPHKVIPSDGDHMALAQITKAMKDLGDPHRHGGFSGSGPSRKRHVKPGGRTGEIHRAAGLLDQQQGCNLTNSGFDRRQPHQILIQLFKHLRYA